MGVRDRLLYEVGVRDRLLIRFRGELALSPTLAWMTTAHYDNLSTVLGINSRIRWWPRAGQRLDIVFVRGVDERRGVAGRIDDTAVTVKYSHNFRF